MRAQAKQAGPGPGRENALPAGSEAAGPASPRLVLEEVTTRLGSGETEVIVKLAAGRRRFDGKAVCATGERQPWELAAAASAAAIQQYLHQCAPDPSIPQVHLLDAAGFAAGIGHEFIAARVRVVHSGTQADLLGSALVRDDRSRAAVAAALNAVSRYLGRFPAARGSPARGVQGPAAAPEQATSDTAPVDHPPATADLAPPPHSSDATGAAPRPPPERSRAPSRPGPAARSSVVGVAIEPAQVYACTVDARGSPLRQAQRAADGRASPEEAVALAVEAVREALDHGGAGDLGGIGVAAGPPFLSGSSGAGDPLDLDLSPCPDLEQTFAREFGVPVSLISTTQAAALAEASLGAARGIADMLYLRVGSGMDLAVILAGRLALREMPPGQVGHMVLEPGGPRCVCGESGCWQALAGFDALIARVARAVRSGHPSAASAYAESHAGAVTPALVVRLASAGDAVARRAVEETGRALALGMANLAALFGPQAVIIEGDPPAVGAALRRSVETSLKSSPRARLLSQCVLLAPEVGDSAAALGAAAWAARGGG